MATSFMKWLETTPQSYDRGIRLITLGRSRRLKERIAAELVTAGDHVLELGCGTGTLTVMMASRGAKVTAIDISPKLLGEAQRKAARAGVGEAIDFRLLDVIDLGDRLEPGSFDVVVTTLVLSELPPGVRGRALREARSLLKPGGHLVVADEVVPRGAVARLLFWLVRVPVSVLTWILTRTTTTPLHDLQDMLTAAGFATRILASYLGGSLLLVSAWPGDKQAPPAPRVFPRLSYHVSVRTFFMEFWCLLTRLIPPYPSVTTGLYRIGTPDRESPVLVTGNYYLTVTRLVRELDGTVDCWLVVANSKGINVWCGAGGGHFTAGDVAAGVKTSGVEEAVTHRRLVLPQLCANGISGWEVQNRTGWEVNWGPVRASDIPRYLEKRQKTDDMRQVSFELGDRLEMTTVMLVMYGLLAAIPLALFWRSHAVLVLGLMVLLAYVYGIFLPRIPGRDGLAKGAVLAAASLVVLWAWSGVSGQLAPRALADWSLGLGFLAFFVGAEFQGMSPLMRGEQANWAIEGVVGVVVLIFYLVSRFVVGW